MGQAFLLRNRDGDDNTDLEAELRGVAYSLYARRTFTVSEAEAARDDPLLLDIDYDDSFVAYLNGREIARKGLAAAGGHVYHDQPAYHLHEAGTTERYAIGPAGDWLVPGDNTLAVQVHNASLTSSDMSLRADLLTGSPDAYHVRHDDTWRYWVGDREPTADVRDEDGERADWIELKNRSTAPVSLVNWALTDQYGVARWLFPEVTIDAGGYLLVLASGKDRRTVGAGTPLHSNFKLAAGGEYLALMRPDGTVASALAPAYPAQSNFHSYGRNDDQTDDDAPWVYLSPPTPGADNGTSQRFSAIAQAPQFGVAQGYHDLPVSLELQAPTGCSIAYTLDGSEPGRDHGAVYDQPLILATTTAVSARTLCPDSIPSPVVSQTYLIGLDDTMKSLPAVAVVGDPENALFEPHGTMAIVGGQYVPDPSVPGCNAAWCMIWQPLTLDDYSQPVLHGRAFERPVSLSVMTDESTDPEVIAGAGFQIDCGTRVAASSWRRPRMRSDDDWLYGDYTKFSFRFYFRDDYQSSRLEYPLFPGSSVTSFDKLVLRGGHNDARNPFIRDELVRRLFLDTQQVGSHGTFANLFINGTYKGFYNLTERLDDDFQRSWWNTDSEFDVLHNFELHSGDRVAWEQLLDRVENSDLSIPGNYQQVAERLDMVNFIDYLLVNIYAATWDWPGNNWNAARERSPTGKFRFQVWDAEGGFGVGGKSVTYNTIASDLQNDSNPIATLYNHLRASADFRQLFAERIALHFFANGALTDAHISARHAQLREIVRPMIERFYGPYNDSIASTWIPQRRTIVLSHFQTAGLWP